MDHEILTTRSERKKVWESASDVTGISRKCDFVLINTTREFILREPIRTIRLHLTDAPRASDVTTKQLRRAIQLIKSLPGSYPISVVMGGTDRTFPSSIDKRHSTNGPVLHRIYRRLLKLQRVCKVFIENMDKRTSDKESPISLGILYKSAKLPLIGNYSLPPVRYSAPYTFTDFNRPNRFPEAEPQFSTRIRVRHLVENSWMNMVSTIGPVAPRIFLSKLRRSPFTLCVHGGGLDPCPKVYEAILAGVIPIVRCRPPLTEAFADLPIAFVKSWRRSSINKKKLSDWYEKLSPHYIDPGKRQEVLRKLSLDHWGQKIQPILIPDDTLRSPE